MIDYILNNGYQIRISFFLGTFVLMATLESLFPRRKRLMSRVKRWSTNFGIVIISSFAAHLFLKLLFIGTFVQFASMIKERGWGLFNYFSSYSVDFFGGEWALIVKGVIIMDLIIYFQHRLAHSNRYLWALHKVHHADIDLDVTSGNRFHPVEILFSLLIKVASIIIWGIHPVAIVIFEVILNGMAQFNHSNFRFPLWPDRFFRLIFVTPDFHRVHHSIFIDETNSNYGFNLSWWDYIFGTYRKTPRLGHEKMEIGLSEYRDTKKLGLVTLLKMPHDRQAFKYIDAKNREKY